MKKDRVFRKKSLKELGRQDDLDSYLKIARPTVWISLGIISVLLIGFLLWGFLGKIEIKVIGVGEVSNNVLVNYIKKDYFQKVSVDKTIRFKNQTSKIKKIGEAVQVDESFDEFLIEFGHFTIGEYVYPCYAEVDIEDGCYVTQTITDVVTPLSYVFK